jgi:hypothetical protein
MVNRLQLIIQYMNQRRTIKMINYDKTLTMLQYIRKIRELEIIALDHSTNLEDKRYHQGKIHIISDILQFYNDSITPK